MRKLKYYVEGGIIETTPGRVIFNTIVPKELGFQNYVLRKKRLSELVLECYKKVGLEATVRFLDNLKNLGFSEATKAALSMGVCDVRIPADKPKVLKMLTNESPSSRSNTKTGSSPKVSVIPRSSVSGQKSLISSQKNSLS